jgi:hypothetical protein
LRARLREEARFFYVRSINFSYGDHSNFADDDMRSAVYKSFQQEHPPLLKEELMKTVITAIALVLSSASVSVSASALAATPPLWDCSGGSLEGLQIYKTPKGLAGSVTWDCFPGDGICAQETAVERVVLNNGDQIFEGKSYKLIVHTSVAPTSDGYKAHIIAKDEVDSADAGRGMSLDQFVDCQEHE